MRRKINYDLVKSEFDERGYILLTTEYINNIQKLEYICPHHIDKGIQTITFANFTKGRGCPYCAKRKCRNQEEYITDLAVKKPNIEVLGEYVNLKTKILHKCKVCGYEWYVKPNNLLHNKNGCPKCGKRAKLTHEEFLEKLNTIHSDIIPLDNYTTHATKIRFQCKKCGNIWEATPNNILNGEGCPKCKLSKGEKAISYFLDRNNIEYISQYKFQDCFYINLLPFDFYLPKFNLCIEYDGIQHFQPCTFGGVSFERAEKALELCKLKDKIKTEYCKNNNIKLLRIPYTQFNNIDNILTSILS